MSRLPAPTNLTGPIQAARLSRFFSDLGDLRRKASAADLPTRLSELFARLRPLLAGEPDGGRPPPPGSAPTFVDEARLRRVFEQLAGPLEQARRDGSLADVWDIAGLGRNEVRTAAALAALWNPRLCGTVAIEFLAAFLARLAHHDNLPTRAELETGYTIRTEDRPLGRADERVDIVIEGRSFLLGIELKIDAGEGEQQLSAYRNALQARARLRFQRPTLIYLSRRAPLDPLIDRASWSDVAGAADEVALRHAAWSDIALAGRSIVPRNITPRAFVHQLIAQFGTHVASF